MKKNTKLALALAGAMVAGYCGPDLVFRRHVTPLFNTKAASTCGDIPEYRLPSAAVPQNAKQEIWRVRVGIWEIAAGGHHMYLEFLPYNGEGATCQPDQHGYQVHGLMMDGVRKTWAQIDFMKPSFYYKNLTGGYDLKVGGVRDSYNNRFFWQPKIAYVDIHYGPKDEILKLYLDAMELAKIMNGQNLKYNMLTHNSNSVFRAMVDGLGLPLPDVFQPDMSVAFRNKDRVWWTPAVDRKILPPEWDREKARIEGGYGRLSGKALETRVNRALIHPEKSWDIPMPPPPPEEEPAADENTKPLEIKPPVVKSPKPLL